MYFIFPGLPRADGADPAAHGRSGNIDGTTKILHLLTRSSRTQVELARACDIEPATVSKILDLMEQAGMIERVRSDKDRRSIQVQITEFGAQQHAKMSEIHAEVEALALEGFSAEEREQFINYIQRMTDNLRGEKTAAEGENRV